LTRTTPVYRKLHRVLGQDLLSFPALILELRGKKWNKIWTQRSPQHKEQVPNDVLSNPNISLPILDELEEPRFWGNREKSTKLKELEPWIHSMIGGRR
jgi:hypothetical protein